MAASVRGPYSDYAAPPVYVSPAPPRRGVQFSRTELFQLGVAILGLSAAFTIVILNPFYGGTDYLSLFSSDAVGLAFFFLVALMSVGTGVGLHEIMHKITAERYGHWAEFRYSLRGLLFTFVLAFVGFLFGAPGATYISGYVTPEQNAKISAAGPLTNITLGVVFGVPAFLLYPMAYVGTLDGYLFLLFQFGASINLILAAFNMIPVMPLDGAKVWAWNKGLWIAILAMALVILGIGVYGRFLFF